MPVQAGSGTPSPTNVRTISGFTECTVWDRQINQWDEEWFSGTYGTDGSTSINNNYISSLNKIKVKPNTTYYIKKPVSLLFIASYDVNGNFIERTNPQSSGSSNYIFTTDSRTYYINFTVGGVSFPIPTYNNNISINYPATDTDYHTYKATTATISFGSAGIVYSGEVDLISGKLVVNRARVDIGSLTWSYYDGGSGKNFFWASITGKKNEYQYSTAICEIYNNLNTSVSALSYAVNLLEDKQCVGFATSGGDPRPYFYIRDDDYTDAVSFTNAVNGHYLVYPLATPQEYQLTPVQLRSLVGTNNLTSSTGEVTEVEYIRNETISWVIDQIQDNSIEWTVIP